MNPLLSIGILLAQQGRAQDLAGGFHGRSRVDNHQLFLGVLVVVGLIVFAVVISQLMERRRRNNDSPLGLFFALAKAHRLSWRHRWVLWRVTRAQRLRDPARVFVEPQRLAAAAAKCSPKGRAKIEALRARLFGGGDTAAMLR